jgi:predicted dehydrogenase
MKAAIIGTGAWAAMAHVPALRKLPNVEVRACVGLTPDDGTRFAEAEGIPKAYGSVDELLASEDCPDLIAVVTPNDAHAEATTAALEARVPVFCEKPLTNDATTAATLASLALERGVVNTVGYSFRYSPAVQELRRALHGGVLGEPWLVELFEHNSQFHPRYGKPMNWKGDPAHAAGGSLFEYGSHAIDIAFWLIGEVTEVSATFKRILDGPGNEDIAVAQLRFANGAIGTLIASWVLSGSFPGLSLRVHGSDGLGEAVLSQGPTPGEVYRHFDLDGTLFREVPLDPPGPDASAYTSRHYHDFHTALRGERSELPGTLPALADGARVHGVLAAALRSAREQLEAVRTMG